MTNVVEIQNLTKDYGEGKGIFDVNLTIKKGEMVGFVGTNGSGKTTTIRCIMGFIKPTSGKVLVNGLETWKMPAKWQNLSDMFQAKLRFQICRLARRF